LSLDALSERHNDLTAELQVLDFLLQSHRVSNDVERQRFIDTVLELPRTNFRISKYIRVHRLCSVEQLNLTRVQIVCSLSNSLSFTYNSQSNSKKHTRQSPMATIGKYFWQRETAIYY
jgi:hypothetical protein